MSFLKQVKQRKSYRTRIIEGRKKILNSLLSTYLISITFVLGLTFIALPVNFYNMLRLPCQRERMRTRMGWKHPGWIIERTIKSPSQITKAVVYFLVFTRMVKLKKDPKIMHILHEHCFREKQASNRRRPAKLCLMYLMSDLRFNVYPTIKVLFEIFKAKRKIWVSCWQSFGVVSVNILWGEKDDCICNAELRMLRSRI